MAALTPTLSPVALLHACFVQIAPEVNCFDTMITRKSRSASPTQDCPNRIHQIILFPNLPIEILLIIRAHLVALLMSHHLTESESALTRYEERRRSVLCPDCRSYNEYVFGSDVWTWEGPSGPCLCHKGGLSAALTRQAYGSDMDLQPFTTRGEWVESHLSRSLADIHGPGSGTIWKAVEGFLCGLGCELVALHPKQGGKCVMVLRRRTLPGTSSETCFCVASTSAFSDTMEERIEVTTHDDEVMRALNALGLTAYLGKDTVIDTAKRPRPSTIRKNESKPPSIPPPSPLNFALSPFSTMATVLTAARAAHTLLTAPGLIIPSVMCYIMFRIAS